MTANLRSPQIPWSRHLSAGVNYLLVAGMMACLALALVQLGQRLFPGWSGGYLVLVGFIIALEALLSNRIREESGLLSLQWILQYLTEWIVILIGIKAVLYFSLGWAHLVQDVPAWRADFVGFFFTTEYIISVLFALMIWVLTWVFAEQLTTLEEDPEVLELRRLGYMPSDMEAARRKLSTTVFVIGGVLLILAALVRLDLTTGQVRLISQPGRVWHLVVYFLLGLALLAQARYAALRNHWYLENIPAGPNLAARWALYSLLLFGTVSCLALVLPTQYSIGLLDLLKSIIGIFVSILGFLEALLIYPMVAFFQWIGNLFGKSPTGMLPPLPPRIEAPPPSAASTVPVAEWIKSLVFWAVFLGIIGFSLYYYFRQRAGVRGMIDRAGAHTWWIRIWTWLKSRLFAARKRIMRAIESGLSRLSDRGMDASGKQGRAVLRIGGLPPRERVRMVYLALLRRAEESGFRRRSSQTPAEFAQILDQALPENHPEIQSLTDSFIEARYSRHEITPEAASFVMKSWARIRAALSRRTVPGQEP